MEWRRHIARYGEASFPGEGWVRWTFLAVLLLAAILRFWDLADLPFTHDELSALVRIFPTLRETIQRGVIELDTHPPGVQFFEWAWTSLFGMSSLAVKLPFVLFSLVALFLLFRSALAWTSAPTALFSLTLLATLQFSVMYGQIARPYAAGLFTTALVADQLTRFIAFGRHKQLIGTGIGLLLSAYTHHFALMLAAIMAVTGLVLVEQRQRNRYMLMCAAVALLYLPNVTIVLKQLGWGGLAGWLAAPDKYWLVDHVRWLLHYSGALAIVVCCVLVFALLRRPVSAAHHGPARWFMPAWGLLPLVVGYAYSIWHAPVLQYSMLLFSFPYVLFALFTGLRGLGRGGTIAICAITAIFATSSLILQRHHYTVFYTSRYEAMVNTARDVVSKNGPGKTLVLFDAPEPQVRFYLDRLGLGAAELPYVQLRKTIDPGALDSILVARSPQYVVLGLSNGAASEHVARVQAHLPYLLERQDHVEGQVLVFGKEPQGHVVEDRELIAELVTGDSSQGPCTSHADLPIEIDGTGVGWWSFAGREFGVACELPLSNDPLVAKDLIEVEAILAVPSARTELSLITELLADGKNLHYGGSELNSYVGGRTVTLIAAVSRSWVFDRTADVLLKTYIYNHGKGNVRARRFAVHRRSANPVQNAMLAPIISLGYQPE